MEQNLVSEQCYLGPHRSESDGCRSEVISFRNGVALKVEMLSWTRKCLSQIGAGPNLIFELRESRAGCIHLCEQATKKGTSHAERGKSDTAHFEKWHIGILSQLDSAILIPWNPDGEPNPNGP